MEIPKPESDITRLEEKLGRHNFFKVSKEQQHIVSIVKSLWATINRLDPKKSKTLKKDRPMKAKTIAFKGEDFSSHFEPELVNIAHYIDQQPEPAESDDSLTYEFEDIRIMLQKIFTAFKEPITSKQIEAEQQKKRIKTYIRQVAAYRGINDEIAKLLKLIIDEGPISQTKISKEFSSISIVNKNRKNFLQFLLDSVEPINLHLECSDLECRMRVRCDKKGIGKKQIKRYSIVLEES